MPRSMKVLGAALAGALVLGGIGASPALSHAQTVQVRGIDHVGLNVPDMDAAIQFFSTNFGFAPATEMKDIPVDDGFRKTFNLHSGSKVRRITMLRAGNGSNLELFQYESPDSNKVQPYYDDAGAAHVAFYTDDITSAVAALRSKGIKVLTDPIVMTQGPTAGESWAYFLTPWGAKLELVTYPKGKAYEKQGGTVRLWTPAPIMSRDAGNLPVAEVQAVADGYIPLFNEKDATIRAGKLPQYFASDVTFIDPETSFVGTTSLNDLIGTLQKRNPTWVFKQLGKPAVSGNSARIPWVYGPADSPDKVTGEDVIALRDGKVISLSTFLIATK